MTHIGHTLTACAVVVIAGVVGLVVFCGAVEVLGWCDGQGA